MSILKAAASSGNERMAETGAFLPFQSDRFNGSSCQEQTLAVADFNGRLGDILDR